MGNRGSAELVSEVPQIEAQLVGSELLGVYWSRLHERLSKVLREKTHGERTTFDVFQDIAAGNSQLWLAVQGTEVVMFAVTSVRKFPRKTHLCVEYIEGEDLPACAKVFGMVEDFARYHKCEEIIGYARKGLAKFAEKSMGFEHYAVLISKRL
jgi:hypothetical protein